jgi:hypothetical protein
MAEVVSTQEPTRMCTEADDFGFLIRDRAGQWLLEPHTSAWRRKPSSHTGTAA